MFRCCFVLGSQPPSLWRARQQFAVSLNAAAVALSVAS
ncbi:hypothetical protein I547_1117 [Mycobacterium kansasii 824]|nr:hypothetical protein I547_1117 [Mycobacterium kansasii 824]KEP43667.1 hypothetical protein MKSMC1_12330 [Mycobacterium kansasii]